MENRGVFTKILACVGTALVWFPVLAPVVLGLASLAYDGVFRFDYLMPAELGLSFLAGAGLLLWSSIRARSQRRIIGGGLAAALLLVTGGQGLAVLSGLASGEREPEGFWVWVVTGAILGYALAIVVTGVGGVLLLRTLFRRGA